MEDNENLELERVIGILMEKNELVKELVDSYQGVGMLKEEIEELIAEADKEITHKKESIENLRYRMLGNLQEANQKARKELENLKKIPDKARATSNTPVLTIFLAFPITVLLTLLGLIYYISTQKIS